MIFLGSMWSLWYCSCFRLKSTLFPLLFLIGFPRIMLSFISLFDFWVLLHILLLLLCVFFVPLILWVPNLFLFFLLTPNLKLCSAPFFFFILLYLMFLFYSIFFLSCLSCFLISFVLWLPILKFCFPFTGIDLLWNWWPRLVHVIFLSRLRVLIVCYVRI